MEIYEMSDSQRENRIEELNIAIDNLLEARKHLESTMNDISDICEADDLMGYLEQDLRELNHVIDQLNDELQELLDFEPSLYDDFEERMREFNESRF